MSLSASKNPSVASPRLSSSGTAEATLDIRLEAHSSDLVFRAVIVAGTAYLAGLEFLRVL